MILSGISIGFESAVYTALVIASAVYGAFLLSGSIVVSLFAVALAGTTKPVIGPVDLKVKKYTDTIVYAWGSAAQGNLTAAVQTVKTNR